MHRFAQLGSRPGKSAFRIDKVHWRIHVSAFAAVPVLILPSALRARAAHKTIGEKTPLDRVVQLFDFSLDHVPALAKFLPKQFAETARLRRIRASVIVELDAKSRKVGAVRLINLGDKFLFGHALFLRGDGDRRAVSVVGAKVATILPSKLLKSNPNVGTNVLDQMPDMNIAVGVGQRARYQNPSTAHRFSLMFDSSDGAVRIVAFKQNARDARLSRRRACIGAHRAQNATRRSYQFYDVAKVRQDEGAPRRGQMFT